MAAFSGAAPNSKVQAEPENGHKTACRMTSGAAWKSACPVRRLASIINFQLFPCLRRPLRIEEPQGQAE
jgi:hypothetical protein